MQDQTKPDPVLPPLPTGLPSYEFPDGAYSGDDMKDYGLACYAQARADLIAEMRPVASAQITPGCGGLNIEATFSGHLYLCDDPRIATGGAPLAIIPEK